MTSGQDRADAPTGGKTRSALVVWAIAVLLTVATTILRELDMGIFQGSDGFLHCAWLDGVDGYGSVYLIPVAARLAGVVADPASDRREGV